MGVSNTLEMGNTNLCTKASANPNHRPLIMVLPARDTRGLLFFFTRRIHIIVFSGSLTVVNIVFSFPNVDSIP